MKKIIATSLICSSLLFAANSEYKYEITPMLGGAFTEGNLDLDRDYANAGLSLGFNLDDSMFDQVELGFLRTLEDVDYKNSTIDTSITRVFTNLIKEYDLGGKSSLYALIGAGVEVFGDEQFGNKDGLFGNYGVGYKYKLDNDMAIKADIRHLVEIDNGDNNLIYTVGLAIPFGKKAAPAPVVVEEPKKVEPPKPLDSDKDGVIDSMDKCPNTKMGVKVDANGCELDSDNDGVVDSLDKCPNTISEAIVDQNGCAVVVDLKINFDINSSIIQEQYKARIKKFADYLNSNPKLKATIEGHTDAVGTEKYNQWLSERRANSAAKALESYDVDSSKLSTVGFGETQPITTNKTKEGRAENRRIQAVISK